MKQLLDESGERVGAYRVFRRGDDVLPGLAMSRSLGDLYAQAVGVSPEPVLNTYSLTERDLFVVRGCASVRLCERVAGSWGRAGWGLQRRPQWSTQGSQRWMETCW